MNKIYVLMAEENGYDAQRARSYGVTTDLGKAESWARAPQLIYFYEQLAYGDSISDRIRGYAEKKLIEKLAEHQKRNTEIAEGNYFCWYEEHILA